MFKRKGEVLFAAGESIAAIAKDYEQPFEAVEDAVRCVVGGASGRFGIRREVERRMEAEIVLERRDD